MSDKSHVGQNMYKCRLPIPFVKGSPIDYLRMSVDQLKKFIPFMYKCQYKAQLPISEANGVGLSKPPSWWLQTVSFDRHLRVKAPLNRGLSTQQKELSTLVRQCYESHGVASLLALGRELSSKSGFTLKKTKSRNWKVVDEDGRTHVMVDVLTRTYDSTAEERDIFVGKESQENAASAADSVRLTRNQKTNFTSKNETRTTYKRKLFETEEAEKETFPCAHCKKAFRVDDFRDEHQAQCVKGPSSETQDNQMNFMNALGLFGSSQQVSTKSSSSDPPVEPTTARPRNLRKLPRRNQLMGLFKNHPIPITSQRGQRFVEELGDKQEHRYPPEFEKQCTPRSGIPVVEKDYPSVAKRVILKNGENPHIYTQGRRQRTERYQELVVGLKQKCWPLLNSCKPIKLVVDKLSPTMKSLQIPPNKSTYLERKWKPALTLPCVRLVDFKKVKLTDEMRRYLPKNVESPKPGTSNASAY